MNKKLISIVIAGGIALGASACSGGEPTHYATPSVPASVSAAPSASAAPQNEALISTGGVDAAAVAVPEDIKAQYGVAAGTIAKDALSAYTVGLGNQNALAPRVKTAADYDVLREHLTAEAQNSISNQDSYTYDAQGLLEGAGTRVVETLSTVVAADGTVPMPDGSKLFVSAQTSVLGVPVIGELKDGTLARVAPAESVQVDESYKVLFAGTVNGKDAQVIYVVRSSVAVVPSASGWLVADAVHQVPTAVEGN